MPTAQIVITKVDFSNIAEVCQNMRGVAETHLASLIPQLSVIQDPYLRNTVLQNYLEIFERYRVTIWENR
jgi:hypothetical protein